MWTTDAGVRFELSPWRARRVIAQAKEIARRRRDGQASLPGGVLHDLQRMARFARPVKNMVHQPTGNQLRVFEAQLPDGMFRMMTQSRPGLESVWDVEFRATQWELEQETAIRNGVIDIQWKTGKPVPLATVTALKKSPDNKEEAKKEALDKPGVYILFRRYDGDWRHKYVGVADDASLRERLLTRKKYARQHGDLKNLWVIWGTVTPADKRNVLAAEHAIIRTLDPTEEGYPRVLTNRSSIRMFKTLGGLKVTNVLPEFLRDKHRNRSAFYGRNNPDKDSKSDVLFVPPNQRYEVGFR